jgi:hypothetical protein
LSAASARPGLAAAAQCSPRRAAETFLHAALFITILSSPFVFIEPSPYEFLMLPLALACVAAGVKVPRLIAPLFFLLMLWNFGGMLSLLNVHWKSDAVMFMVTSLYLSGSAVLFACLFAEDSVRRLAIMRNAYVVAALLAATVGIAAYFNLFPGAEQLTMGGRAKSTFKDPNVYAPFLVLPLLFLVEGTLREGVRPARIMAAGVLVAALLLAFSRGAWMNAAASTAVMLLLMFVAARGARMRGRILFLGLLAVAGIAALVILLISFESIGGLFKERAALVQYYDVGEAGRFGNQIRSLTMLIERPNGFGPLEFGAIFPQAPHNVYLNAFSAYGWLGGITYLLLILTSLALGFQHALTRAPWQPFFIPIYSAFVGVVLEGAIVDTDHWRHFFLLLGAVWGLSAATTAHARRAPASPRVTPAIAPSSGRAKPHFVVSKIG